MSYTKADRNDKFGLEAYGKDVWLQKCNYDDNKNARKEQVFLAASNPENMQKLFSLINGLVGENMKFKYTVNNEKQEIYFKSEVDLSDRPFINLAWKQFRIENFNGGVGCSKPYYSYGEERDYSKPVEKVWYRVNIDFTYKHHNGGTNGAEIATAFFEEGGTWVLKSAKEN